MPGSDATGPPAAPDPPGAVLLATKLFIPPAAPALVARPRLLARLDAALRPGHRLTLVVAPPGWGKTTLLGAWLAGLAPPAAGGPAVAWVALDGGDNDPVRFWSYVLAALGPIHPGGTAPLLASLQSPQPPPVEAVLSTLLNGLAAPQAPAGVLVLDDYQQIETPAIHSAIAFLIEHLPPHLHLVLASRADPPLPVGRLRARGALAELRAADLGFTPAEAAAFLNDTMGLALRAEAIAALESRTEGWIAILQLAALAMRDQRDIPGFIAGFTGSHRFVVDYLAEEVFARQAPDVQDFLLATAVLDRMSAPLCAAVLGSADNGADAAAQARLEQLERANLFLIPLDDERRWYRYHHLFADVLRARLRQQQPGRVAGLYARAAAWCAGQAPAAGPELLTEAVQYALAAGDPAYAARLVEEQAPRLMWRHGDFAAARRWLALLPTTQIAGSILLCLISAQIAFIAGDLAGLQSHVAQAGRDLDALADPPAALRGGVAGAQGWVATLTGDLARGRALLHEALAAIPGPSLERELTRHALGEFYLRSGDHAPAGPLFAAVVEQSQAGGYPILAISALSGLTRCRIFAGRLPEAAAGCREGLRLAAASGSEWGGTVANLHWMLGMILYEWNDLAAAEAHTRRAAEIGRLGEYSWLRMAAALTLAQVLLARGDHAAAAAALDESEQIATQIGHPRTTAQIAAIRILSGLPPGPAGPPPRQALRAALDGDLAAGSDPVFAVEPQYYAPLRVLLQDARTPAATAALVAPLLAAEEAAGRPSRLVALLALQAGSLAAQGETGAARGVLERARALGAAGGYTRAFLDAGDHLGRLLPEAPAAPPGGDAGRHPHPIPGAGAPPPPAGAPMEMLTEREIEVLRLVAAGASNRQIAAQLIVSLGTVKKHLNNIFGKLGVQSRTQAIVQARAAGLLD